MKWQIIDTGQNAGEDNMAKDYGLLRELSSLSHPVLHLYDWEQDSATYGYFFDPFTVLIEKGIAKRKLKLIRRPTGGGTLFHVTDFAFSVIIPATNAAYSTNTMQNYAYVNQFLVLVIKKFFGKDAQLNEKSSSGLYQFCMAEPVQNDVMIGHKKVVGGAQRRTKQGFLHQGSLFLASPGVEFLSDLIKDPNLIQKMQENSFDLVDIRDIKNVKAEFKDFLTKEIQHL